MRKLRLKALARAGAVGGLLAALAVGMDSGAYSAEAMSAQSVPGTFASSVTVINPSSDPNTANTSVQFYDGSGNLTCTAYNAATGSSNFPVAPGSSLLLYVPNVTCGASGPPLPAGATYSAVVNSDQQVYAVVSLASSNPSTGDQYDGALSNGSSESASTIQYIPSALREYYGNTSTITVQNTGTASTVASIQLIGNGINTCVQTTSLAPNAGYTLDLESALPNGTTLPTGFNGAATVFSGSSCTTPSGGSPALAVVTSKYQPSANPAQYGVTNAFAVAGHQAYVPGLYSNYYGNYSSLVVQNADTTTTNVTVTYYTGTNPVATDVFNGLAPNASHVFYTPNAGTCTGCSGSLPSGWQGSAVVTSSGQNILAQVDKQASTGASLYAAAVSGTVNIFAPSLLNNYYNENGAFTIQNVDTAAATVQVTWGTSPACTETLPSLGPGQSTLLYIPNINPSHGHSCTIPSGYHGGATVTSLGGQKLVGLVSTAGNGVYSDEVAPGQ